MKSIQKVRQARVQIWPVYLVCLFLAACGNNLATIELSAEDIESAQHSPPSETLQEKVDTLARPMVETGYTPGLIVGVLLPNGDRKFFSYGVADQDTGLKPNRQTLFAVGSLSKGYLGAIAALLVDEGVFSWDETLRTLLPPNTPLSPDAEKITLLQLATHTSGLPRQPVTLQTLQYFVEYLFDGENFYRHFDRDYLLNYLADFESDTHGEPLYSNIGYGLLSYILERRTGLSVDALLEKKIVKPLGLKCTGYTPEILPCYVNRARGYAGDHPKFITRGQPTPDWHFTSIMRGAAAMYSNADELLTFAAAHMKGKKTRFNAVLASDLDVRYPLKIGAAGVAWTISDVEGDPIAYQVGIVAGYTSYVGIDIQHKTAIVAMQNSFNWDTSVGNKLLLNLRYMAALPH